MSFKKVTHFFRNRLIKNVKIWDPGKVRNGTEENQNIARQKDRYKVKNETQYVKKETRFIHDLINKTVHK